MDAKFYGRNDQAGGDELVAAIKANPELFKQFMAFVSMAGATSANKI